MGCFLACFGLSRRRQQSPARSPPRSIHVAVAREAAAPHVAVKEVSPPLRGAKPSTLAEAVEAPDEEVVAEAADVAANDDASLRLPSQEVKKALTPPSAADEEVTDASPVKELRDLSEQKVLEKQAAPSHSPVKCSTVAAVQDSVECSPVVQVVVSAQDSDLRDLSEKKVLEKQAAVSHSPVKCSPTVAAVQDSVECSPVVVVSAQDSDLREVSGHGSRSSGKKKVTFDMNVTTYENAVPPDQEEEPLEEDENYVLNTVVLPETHRYRNCSDSDYDFGDEYAEDGVYGDDSDEDEEDFMDCKIDLVDEEEIRIEENKQESQESLFSLSMSNDQQNDQEVVSPAPKSSGTPAEAESPLIATKKLRDRCQYVHPVLNPVQNLSQWKEVKSLKAQPVRGKMFDKENVNLMLDGGPNYDCNSFDKENVNLMLDGGPSYDCNSASHTRMNPSMSSKREISLDASLSTWLVSSENSTVDMVQSKSPCSNSSVTREERPILGALTVDDLKLSSTASSQQTSPRTNQEGALILGTVGSYWHCTDRDNECASGSTSGTNGIPNTTSKYREDKRVTWHSTPFNVRLDRALKKTSA